jgi:hypothetical protein
MQCLKCGTPIPRLYVIKNLAGFSKGVECPSCASFQRPIKKFVWLVPIFSDLLLLIVIVLSLVKGPRFLWFYGASLFCTTTACFLLLGAISNRINYEIPPPRSEPLVGKGLGED